MAEGKHEKQDGKEDGSSIKIDFGDGDDDVEKRINRYLDLDMANQLAEFSGSADAQGRVAEMKRRLAERDNPSGTEEGQGEAPQIASSFNVSGLLDGLLGGGAKGEGEDADGGFLGNLLRMVGKVAEIADSAGAQGEGGTQAFNIGGTDAIFHVESGGGVGSVKRGGMHTRFGQPIGTTGSESDFRPEQAVVRQRSSAEEAAPVAPPSENGFALEATDAGKQVFVFGDVPPFESEGDIGCEVTDDGNKLVVTVKDQTAEVQLPSPVDTDPEHAKAEYNNGMFSVRLQKVKPVEPEEEEQV